MRRGPFRALTMTGISLILAGAAFAQTSGPAPSTGTPGTGTGPTSPRPTPSPAQPSPGTPRGSTSTPSPGSAVSPPRSGVGQSTPGITTPGTTMRGTATPGTTMPTTSGTGTSSLPPTGDGQISAGQMRSVQQALQGKGMDPGAIDGVMGPKTQEAVRNFQKAQNLPQTGRVDAQTLEKLGISPR
jgi:Putative peptidoglycan binding domain